MPTEPKKKDIFDVMTDVDCWNVEVIKARAVLDEAAQYLECKFEPNSYEARYFIMYGAERVLLLLQVADNLLFGVVAGIEIATDSLLEIHKENKSNL